VLVKCLLLLLMNSRGALMLGTSMCSADASRVREEMRAFLLVALVLMALVLLETSFT